MYSNSYIKSALVRSMIIIMINYPAMMTLHKCFNWVSSPSLFRGSESCCAVIIYVVLLSVSIWSCQMFWSRCFVLCGHYINGAGRKLVMSEGANFRGKAQDWIILFKWNFSFLIFFCSWSLSVNVKIFNRILNKFAYFRLTRFEFSLSVIS